MVQEYNFLSFILSPFFQFAYHPDLEPLTAKSIQPSVGIAERKLGAREHSSVELVCEKPLGVPRPRLWWEGPSGNLIADASTDSNLKSDDERYVRLLIQSVTPAHKGNYTCVAQNSLGHVTRTAFQLVVTSKWSKIFSDSYLVNFFYSLLNTVFHVIETLLV